MEVYGEVLLPHHAFLPSAVDGCKYSVLCPACFKDSNHWMGGCVVLRSMDILNKRKISCPCPKIELYFLGCTSCSLVTVLTTLLHIHNKGYSREISICHQNQKSLNRQLPVSRLSSSSKVADHVTANQNSILGKGTDF
jgi:hypothetical protein